MNLKDLFKKAENELEDTEGSLDPKDPSMAEYECPSCHAFLRRIQIRENFSVCPACGHHYKMSARRHVLLIADDAKLEERYADAESTNTRTCRRSCGTTTAV